MITEMLAPLIEEIELGGAKVRNRFVRSATHEWLADADGRPSEKIGEMYTRLAEHDVGLIISGYSFVSPCGRSSERQQAVFSDEFIAAYSSISKAVRALGARFFIQLVHGGRQALVTRSCPVTVAPSPLPLPGSRTVPRELTDEDIQEIIGQFVSAVERCVRGGADGVQLHCAHGFLLSSFLSPYTNRREDDWGGDTERRTRIVTEILSRTRRRGLSVPVIAKINCTDGVEGGIDRREAVRISEILDQEGIAALEISGGMEDAQDEVTCRTDILSAAQEGYFREESRAIRNAVSCPVMLVGGLRSLPVMSQMIVGGYADMVSMSRPLIREPDLVTKFLHGRQTGASCASCNRCFDERGIRCDNRVRAQGP